VASGDDVNVFNYLENGQLFALAGAGSETAETSVVAPSLLIDDLELVRMEDEQPKLPLVPAPELSLTSVGQTIAAWGGRPRPQATPWSTHPPESMEPRPSGSGLAIARQ
jgi:hypothetical protein